MMRGYLRALAGIIRSYPPGGCGVTKVFPEGGAARLTGPIERGASPAFVTAAVRGGGEPSLAL